MRKFAFIFVLAVVALVVGGTVFWFTKQPPSNPVSSVSKKELIQAEKIERFLLFSDNTASNAGQITKITLPEGYKGSVPTPENPEKFITEKARDRVTKRKILEREIPNFKIDSNAPAFSPDGRFFPQDLAATYNYDRLLTEAVRQKIEGSATIKTVAVNFSSKSQNQAEKIINELFKGQSATASAGITINNFSSVLTGDAAQNFRPDEKPVLISSPMGQSYSFTKIVSRNKGLGISFDQWLKKFL